MRHEEGGRARLLASLRGVPAICSVDAEGGYAARRGGVHHGGDSPPRADFAGWSFSFPSPVCILFNPAEKESRDTFLPRRIPPGPPQLAPLHCRFKTCRAVGEDFFLSLLFCFP